MKLFIYAHSKYGGPITSLAWERATDERVNAQDPHFIQLCLAITQMTPKLAASQPKSEKPGEDTLKETVTKQNR